MKYQTGREFGCEMTAGIFGIDNKFSRFHLFGLALLCYAVCVAGIDLLYGYQAYLQGCEYITLTKAIRTWSFSHIQTPKLFWGLPYAAAITAKVLRVPDVAAVLGVVAAAYFASIALAYRLWGGSVAAVFTVISWPWLQQTAFGGAEPLFVLLLFCAFWAARAERWRLATLFA